MSGGINANALLIAELVDALQTLTRQYETAVLTLEKYQDDAEHWKGKYHASVGTDRPETQ